MVRMGTSSVYIDLDKAEELSKKGLTVSMITQAAISLALTDDFEDLAVEMRLDELDNKIEKLRVEIAGYGMKLEVKQELLERYTSQKNELIAEREEARDTVILAKYIRSLNQVIIASGYDESIVEETAGDLITKIVKVNPHFSLTSHVKRFKRIMDS